MSTMVKDNGPTSVQWLGTMVLHQYDGWGQWCYISTMVGDNGATSVHIIYSHLLVICANRTLSDEKCSSKSNRSREGGGSSLKLGGNTAGCRGGRGVSNWGVISDSVSCFKCN